MLSTYATHGGAAGAALRHHDALRSVGVQSTMVVLEADPPPDRAILTVAGRPCDAENAELRRLVDRIAIRSNRTGLSTAWFSWPLDGVDLTSVPAVCDADVLSVHWVSGLLSQHQFESLFTLGKPVIITMHDEWLLTGGCHYTAGCAGFETDCLYCPQLAEDPVGVPAAVLERRVRFGEHAAGVVVTPSRWLGEQSKRSRVFAGWRHEVIPYACDLDVFRPRDGAASRAELGCDDDRLWLLFIAGNLADKRKGFDVLAEALEHVACNENLTDRLGLVCVGNAPEAAEALSVPVRAVGFVRDEEQLARIYSACDGLVLPSREENLPNTLIESLACGVPVVGSRVGGIPDFVEPGHNGYLVEPGDPDSLAKVLSDIARDPERVRSLRVACRELAESSFSVNLHASRWLAVAADAPIGDLHEPELDEPLQRSVIRLVEARTMGNDQNPVSS
ncbi:MAG: glycosyltransferase, partial [Deltaproteobacteria bacterium]|nr:glycosyltransferase [Deltaproteobacteria bacterium]